MIEVTIAPTTLAVSLADMKRHLGVTSSDRDIDIESLTEAATRYVEKRTKRTLVTTVYRLNLSDCHVPSGEFEPICLPRPPIQSVSKVEYDPGTGTYTEITGYQLVKADEYSYILPAPSTRWPAVVKEKYNAFRVDYTAGYATVPPEAKHCIKLLVRHWYDNASAATESTTKEIELGVASLCRSLGTGFYADVQTHEVGSDY